MEEEKRAWRFLQIQNENKELHRELKYAKERMGGVLQSLIEYKPTRQTGWYVIIKFEKGTPVSCELLDPDDEKWENGEELPPFDAILLVPNPEDLKEFTGF